jgi:hypothetical protein
MCSIAVTWTQEILQERDLLEEPDIDGKIV